MLAVAKNDFLYIYNKFRLKLLLPGHGNICTVLNDLQSHHLTVKTNHRRQSVYIQRFI